MADKVSYKWSSNIGDWDGYWVDMEYFEEKYGEVEFEGETRDGESLEELQALDEETRIVEPRRVEKLPAARQIGVPSMARSPIRRRPALNCASGGAG